MTSKSDRHEILNALESEYLSDLSIHLYSTFLLRRINPNFPKKSWSSWPLAIEEVPIPKDNYEDDIIIEGYKEDIDIWQMKYQLDLENSKSKLKSKPKKKAQQKSIQGNHDKSSEESSDDDSSVYYSCNDGEEEEGDEKEEYEHNKDIEPRNRIIEVSYKRKTTPNAQKILVNSISSIFQRKIEQKIIELKKTGEIDRNLEPSDNISTNPILKPIISQLATRFNNLINDLSCSSSCSSSKETKTWQSVLNSAIKTEINPYENLNTDLYRNVYTKCDALFNKVDYRFEFDSEAEDEDEDENEDGNERETNNNEQVISPNGSFNVGNYLKSLAERSNLIRDQNLSDRYLEIFNKMKDEQDRKKQYFFKALEIQDEYKNISWLKSQSDESTMTKTKKKKKTKSETNKKSRRKRIKVDSDINQITKDILDTTELNENSYTLLNL